MKIKTFKLEEVEKANEFIENVVLQDGGVQLTDNNIVIFYISEKENYEQEFVKGMIESLEKNLLHEEVRKVSVDIDYEYRKDKGTNLEGFDEASDNQRKTEANIEMYKQKIKALKEWPKTADNS